MVVMTIPKKHQLSQPGLKTIVKELKDEAAFDADLPDKTFSEMCRKLNVPFLAGKGFLDMYDYKKYDWHWSKKGHRRVAQLLAHLYDTHKSGKLDSVVVK